MPASPACENCGASAEQHWVGAPITQHGFYTCADPEYPLDHEPTNGDTMSKPDARRTIDSTEEAALLQTRAVVMDGDQEVWELTPDGWRCWAYGEPFATDQLRYPLAVLFDPQDACTGGSDCTASVHVHGCFAVPVQ